jgi:hypothetical protein
MKTLGKNEINIDFDNCKEFIYFENEPQIVGTIDEEKFCIHANVKERYIVFDIYRNIRNKETLNEIVNLYLTG